MQRGKTRRLRQRHSRIEALEARRMLAVVINELVAANTSGLRDQDGDHSDWLELKNTGASAVNLSGWCLTDDAANLTKWQFPSTNLAAGGYLVVFASGKNRAVAGQELHTNFTLDRDGEYLAVVEPNGTTIDSSYSPFGSSQKDDVSYGIAAGPSTVNATIVPHGATAKWYWPSAANAAIDDHWTEGAFNDSTWTTTTTGVGFDADAGDELHQFIPVEQTMANTSARPTAYIRIPFNVTDKDQLTSLTLGMRFDDGFVAYINGEVVAQENADTTIKPAWNQNARNSRPDSAWGTLASNTYDNFDITPYIAKLTNGTNMLAIQGMNSTSQLTDFLVDPLLTATRATGTMTGFMATPTPGANNGAGTQGFVGDTHFSVDRGFFASSFPVAITSNTAGASIRYTLDGSAPTETTGTLYTGPITISTTTVLRAIAYKSGWVSSNADTETYLFLNDVIHQTGATVPAGLVTWGHAGPDWDMDSDVVNNPTYSGQIVNDLKAIPTVSIVMNWNDLFGPATSANDPTTAGIYADTTPWHDQGNERPMSVEYFKADGTQWHDDGAVEVQGGSSDTRWNDDKLSLQLKFKFPYGPTKLDFPIFAGTADGQNAATSFDTLLLDAQYNYTWSVKDLTQASVARFIGDQVVSDYQNLADGGGGGAPHGQFVQLYLNGMYWGMYDLHEKAGDSFSESYFGGDKDNYDVVKHNKTNWANGGVQAVNDYQTLLNAAQAVASNPTSSSVYQSLTNLLDVDAFANYMISLYYGGNWDWGSDNWYAEYDRVTPGAKWHFTAWDQEHSFQTDDNGDPYNVNYDSTTKNDTAEGGPTAIQQWLMSNPEYKLMFDDHVQKLLNNGGLLTPASAQAVFQARVTEVTNAIVGESARWGDNRVATPYTQANWLTTMQGVYDNFFNAKPETRTQILLDQFANTTNHPGSWLQSLAAPNFSNYGGTVTPGFSLTMSKPAGSPGTATIYYTTDGSDPRLAGGALSASAIAYSSALTFNSSAHIKARIKDGANWSPIIDATYVVAGSFPVRIVEMNYHPIHNAALADDEDQEFIELLNTGASAVNLQGAQLTQFGGTPYVFGNYTLAAGQRIVVARNPAVFTTAYNALFGANYVSGITLASTGYSPENLSNGGERIALLSPFGDTVQDFVYDDVAPWPTAPDGNGPTLLYNGPLNAGENPADGSPADPFDNGANWIASPNTGGSPGTDGTPAAPTVLNSSFDFETGQRIVIQFDQDVQASLAASDLTITPLGGGSPITPASYTWNAATKTVTFTLSPTLADGNYRATLPAGSVDHSGPLLANAMTLDFFVLAGDANRDRHVDSADQAILTAHLGQGGTFSQGNFDYAGTIDSSDQAILTGNSNVWLPPQGALVLPATIGDDVQRLRVESGALLDLFLNGAPDNSPSDRIVRSAITSLSFLGGAGNDSLTLDYTNGTPLPAGGIGIDGGNGAGETDTLAITLGAAADTVTFDAADVIVGGSAAPIAHANLERIVFDGGGGGGGGFDNVTINGGPLVIFPSTQHFASLTLGANASAAESAGTNSVLVVQNLSLGAGATLDLADDDFVWDYSLTGPVGTWNGSSYDQLTGMIASGAIFSSSKVGTFKNLGVAESWQVFGAGGGMFGGSESVDGSAALIKYTYVGDATLDGKLNIDDYLRIDASLPQMFTGWFNGDFNYDGKINIDDYLLIDGNLPNYTGPV